MNAICGLVFDKWLDWGLQWTLGNSRNYLFCYTNQLYNLQQGIGNRGIGNIQLNEITLSSFA